MDLYSKEERKESREELKDTLTGIDWKDELIQDIILFLVMQVKKLSNI